jgi:hypothetical protein
MIEDAKNTLLVVFSMLNFVQVTVLMWGPANDQSLWCQYTTAWKKTGVLALRFFGIQRGAQRKHSTAALALFPVCAIGFVMVCAAIGPML